MVSEIRSQSYLFIKNCYESFFECEHAVNVRQHRVGETDESAIYRINDDLEYLVEIYEWSGSNWEPYVANDIQLQATVGVVQKVAEDVDDRRKKQVKKHAISITHERMKVKSLKTMSQRMVLTQEELIIETGSLE
ncbi:hypothetical protein L2E82_15994 [Cichorium intybus]|uniref:Uncharacterized protein n=1 Tax=Cichorium intybus TaxID=13427 RepID=A0ACB9F4B0_CICIN|nr:hypothetical protein L2E82_15994 [Cichorium intybus]